MLVRSEPPGAPVWIDGHYVGVTPLEHGFAHYGTSQLRVGPLRDEHDRLQYAEQARLVEIEAPWYETFPIDFVFEVLLPVRLVDEHDAGEFVLEPAGDQPPAEGRVEDIRARAEAFRSRALAPIPEEPPAQ